MTFKCFWKLYVLTILFSTLFLRLEEGEDVDENRTNLLSITQKVFNAIISSADRCAKILVNLIIL